MRHPITTMMLIVSLVAGGGLALSRMRVDIFPPINQPQIVVFCSGMAPGQMEGLLVNQFELAFQYVDGVKNVELRCISQVALIKIAFYPGTDMAKAMASVVSLANCAQPSMPPNVVGTKASLRLQALAGREFDVAVSRIASTLNKQSRTLMAEVGLPNPDGELLPGMYAYVN